MYPDEVAWLEDFRYACCEGGVGVSVGVPVGGGGCGNVGCDVLPEEVVEERPEGCRGSGEMMLVKERVWRRVCYATRLAIAIIMRMSDLVVQPNRNE